MPGIREVFSGKAVKREAKYHYSWRVRFCHAELIEHYHEHPDFVAFRGKLFRSVVDDKITINFQSLADGSSNPHIEYVSNTHVMQ